MTRLRPPFQPKPLKSRERTFSILGKGFNRETALDMANIIHEETGVAAVAITDAKQVLAFVGEGSDHHRPHMPISSPLTWQAISENKVIFADGIRDH